MRYIKQFWTMLWARSNLSIGEFVILWFVCRIGLQLLMPHITIYDCKIHSPF